MNKDLKDSLYIIGGLISFALFISGVSLTWGTGSVKKDVRTLEEKCIAHAEAAEIKYTQLEFNKDCITELKTEMKNVKENVKDIKRTTDKIYEIVLKRGVE